MVDYRLSLGTNGLYNGTSKVQSYGSGIHIYYGFFPHTTRPSVTTR